MSEILFTLSLPRSGELHWRAFVEPRSGAVLYLRAFVACAQGHVFHTDPISPGAPPDVDVYIDDGRAGGYMPFKDRIDDAQEIWSRTAPDAGLVHQQPVLNATNFVYVRVKNRGTTTANNVSVRAFQSKMAKATTFPTHWTPMTTHSLSVGGGVAPDAAVIVGPFAWTPSFDGQSVLMSVSADGDRGNIELIRAAVPNARLVPEDNNLAQRRF